MNLRKGLVVVALWVAPVFVAGMWGHAQTQAPPRQPRPAPGQALPQPDVISGADIGFRVDSRKGDIPVGRLVVRVNGRWVEPEESVQIRRVPTTPR